MIGRAHEMRGKWLQALILSLALHGIAAAAIMDVLPTLTGNDEDGTLPEIGIISLPLDQGIASPLSLDQTGPVTTTGQTVAATQPPTLAPLSGPTATAEQPILTPSDDMLAATTAPLTPPVVPSTRITATPPRVETPAQPSPGQPAGQTAGQSTDQPTGQPDGPPDGAAQGSPAQSAAISDLVLRLRERLAQPCLAALPQTSGRDEVLLTVLGAEDRNISNLFRDISGTVAVPMTERSVLLDARQCPAVDFARASATYPALPLVVQLEAAEVASDDHLIGEIRGVGGNQAALLLIDDNGVVQDLGRFTLQSGDVIRFDVPVYRVGGNRDTSQLLMAVALPEQPDTIAGLSGRLAGDFFRPLAEAAGGRALIGVAPVYIRAAD